MHYNLLFNGCSITHGGELEGKEQDYEYQRTHRFSHLVAENLGMTYDNISSPGDSNDSIVRRTIEWFEAGNTCDLAIIQFTYFERFEYMCGVLNKPVKVNVGMIDRLFQKRHKNLWKSNYEFSREMIVLYFKYAYNNNDAFYRFYKNLFLLETYFKKNNIKHHFIRINKEKSKFDETAYLWKNLCEHKYNEMTAIFDGIFPFDNKENFCKNIADDDHPFLNGSHPNGLGHQKIANYLINQING